MSSSTIPELSCLHPSFFWNKNNSATYSKQCSRPQRDSNLHCRICFSGRKVGSLKGWGGTVLSLVIRTWNSAHGSNFLFPIHHLPQYMLAQFLLLRCWAANPWEIWRDILNLSQPIWVWANLEAKIKRYINISLFIEGFLFCKNTLKPRICPSFQLHKQNSKPSPGTSQKVHLISHQGVQWATRYFLSSGKIPAAFLNKAWD